MINSISIMRNIAIILVIMGHAGCIYSGRWSYSVVNNNSAIIKYLTDFIYSFHMPLFIFISGYIYNYGKIKYQKYSSTSNLIFNKAKKLLIPYIFTGSFFVIPIEMLFNIYEEKYSYFNRVFNDIILGKNPGHLWYLLMLFNLFIIFRIIENTLRKNKFILNIGILCILSLVSFLIPNIYQLSNSLYYMIYFYLGYWMCAHLEKVNKKKLKFLSIVIFLLLFNIDYFYISAYSVSTIFYLIFNQIYKIMLAIMGVLSIYYLICMISVNIKEYKDSIFNKINKKLDFYGFYIYLLHQPIMLVMLSSLKYKNIQPVFLYLILFTGTLVSSLIISIVFFKTKKVFENSDG